MNKVFLEFKAKGGNAKHFNTWSRKGACPDCDAKTEKKHREGCGIQKEMRAHIND